MRFAIDVAHLDPDVTFEWGGVQITPHAMHHTCPTLGYRLDFDGAAVVYATDGELRPLIERADANGSTTEFGDLVAWARNADLLIHDAQYTDREYAGKRGWGHSSVSDVIRLKDAAETPALALWHHDPAHSDEDIDGMIADLAQGSGTGTFAAAEGTTIQVGQLITR